MDEIHSWWISLWDCGSESRDDIWAVPEHLEGFLTCRLYRFFDVICKFEGDTSEREIEQKPAPALFAKETIIGK